MSFLINISILKSKTFILHFAIDILKSISTFTSFWHSARHRVDQTRHKNAYSQLKDKNNTWPNILPENHRIIYVKYKNKNIHNF